MAFDAGAQAFRRDPADGRDVHVDSLMEDLSPGLDRQRGAFDDHSGAAALPEFTSHHVLPAGDSLEDPVVVAFFQMREVTPDDLFTDFLHLLRGHPGIDVDGLEAAVEAFDMLPEFEDLSAEGPGGVKHRVSQHKPTIPEGDQHF